MQELDHLGFASPCSNDDTGQGNLDVIALVNIAWDLVGSYKRCLKTITDLEAQMQRLHCDVEQFHNVSAKQRDLIESKNRLVWDLSEKERQANVKLLQEREKLKTVKDEVLKI